MVVVNRIDSICGKHKMMQIKFIQNISRRMRERNVLEIVLMKFQFFLVLMEVSRKMDIEIKS